MVTPFHVHQIGVVFISIFPCVLIREFDVFSKFIFSGACRSIYFDLVIYVVQKFEQTCAVRSRISSGLRSCVLRVVMYMHLGRIQIGSSPGSKYQRQQDDSHNKVTGRNFFMKHTRYQVSYTIIGITITGVHSNQDQIWLVRMGEYIGFYVDRRS